MRRTRRERGAGEVEHGAYVSLTGGVTLPLRLLGVLGHITSAPPRLANPLPFPRFAWFISPIRTRLSGFLQLCFGSLAHSLPETRHHLQ